MNDMNDFAKGRYARLVMRDDNGRRITRYVKVQSEGGVMNLGTRVTKDGDRWERVTADAVESEVIGWTEDDLISYTPMRLSLRYGTLVKVDEDSE